MLHLAHKIIGATVKGTDGEIGALEDFYFEENRWTVRYLLVDTGKWFSGKRVLISPMSVRNGWGRTGIRLGLTKIKCGRVRNSKMEIRCHTPGNLTSWPTTDIRTIGEPPASGATLTVRRTSSKRRLERRLPARVSIPRRVTCEASRRARYHLHARNGEIGHVDDFLIGEESWRIRYLLVDTSNWIGGRSVIVSPETVERIDKEDSLLYVGVERDTIKQAPEIDSIQSALDLTETGPPFTII